MAPLRTKSLGAATFLVLAVLFVGLTIVCNHALWDRATVAQVHGGGMRCLSYTVNDEWAAKRLVDLGTDGIITDRVDLFCPA